MYGVFRRLQRIGFLSRASPNFHLWKTTKRQRYARPRHPAKRSIEDDCETTSWDESEIVSSPKTVHEIQAEIAVEAEEANIAEMEIVSGDTTAVDPEIRALIEKTVKAAMARLAKSIAEEARNERMAVAAQLDAKVQQAVEAAMTRLPSLQLKKSKRRN